MNKKEIRSDHFLDILGLKPVPKRVLMDIINHGISTVADISARLNMPKSTIYDALTPLVGQSLINEYAEDSERGKTYGVSDHEQLARIHKQKIEEIQKAHTAMLSFIQNHETQESVARPRIKFYSGTMGIMQAFRDMMWNKKYNEAYLMWPMKDMLESLDEDFLRWHSEQRLQYKVVINAIQRHTDRSLQTKEHDWLKDDFKTKFRRVRYLPKGYDWKMSYWIYGDKVLFASGGSEKIAFTIHSKEFAHIMKLMWQEMWEKARD